MEAKTLELSDTPYPGLRPFRADEADIFFGRERQTDDLLARLAEHRFLAVVGPSGCGKSSLVAAGLMPALATGFMASAGAHWRIAKLRPGERPLANLASALVESRILDDDRAAQPDAPVFLEAALRRGPLGLVEIVRGSALAPDANLLVLVDQFEELFRFSAGVLRDEAEAFVALLLASAAAPRARIYIAITMRSDFLGECAPFHGLPEAINDGLYLTPRLTRDECAACITGPARVFGANVEPALVNRLLNDFGPDPDQLPLLQHALLRMWNRHDADRPSGVKTILAIADYDAIGGLARSLSDHADEALGELDSEHQRIARLMFQRLSDSETAHRDRRAPAHVSEIAELASASIDDVRRVADAFRRRDRCFLMPREGVELTPDTVLDVSHESLLRQWDRAAGWIEEEAEAVATYRRLGGAAREWQRGEPLLGGSSLDRAIAWRTHATAIWARRYGSEAEFAAVCDFIAASEQGRAAKQRELSKARTARLQRSIAAVCLGLFTMTGAIAWIVRPLFYVWEHTAYYATCVSRYDGPHCRRKLTADQVSHRATSFRVVTAGLFGHLKRAEVVNGRGELVEEEPDYSGTDHGRGLLTSRWVYDYDAAGLIASEHQYTSSDELVQGKIYIPVKNGTERLAVFIGADGTPSAVRGRGRVEDSSYYWAERLSRRNVAGGVEETTSYLGAYAEPVPGSDQAFATRRTYNERGYVIALTSLDASGHPMNDVAGNSTLATTYDAAGNAIETVSLDKAGRRSRVSTGWVIQRARFDAYGNPIEISYFDESDNPVLFRDGWHKQTLRFGDDGQLEEARYFDLNGHPTTDDVGCSGMKHEHGERGRLSRVTCIDATGAPQRSRDGLAARTYRYDDHGRKLEETILDASNHRIAGKDGFATEVLGRDLHGRETSVSYQDTGGRPLNNGTGYARSTTTYDDASNTEWTHFLGSNGKPVTLADGYASVKRWRDIWWNIVEERYYDQHDEPAISKDGYAGWRAVYDTRGQKIETIYLDRLGEVVLIKAGYASQKATYDDLGHKIGVRYHGMTGQLAAAAATGIAGWNSRYDPWGNEVERTYIAINGEPTHAFQGEAGWQAEYNRWGHELALRYVDMNGAPALRVWDGEQSFTGQGYASAKGAYDAHQNVVEQAYFGVHGERVARPEGWSYAKLEYDDRGLNVRMSFFGTKNEAVKSHGYHTATLGYDDHGNPIDVRYFDVDGTTPIVSDAGFARIARAFDGYGRRVEETLFGARGERVALSNGTHRQVTTWDEHGREKRREDWGAGDPSLRLRTTESEYDTWGNLVEWRRTDPAGKPVVSKDEPCATWKFEYSDRQEQVKGTCLGTDGLPSPHMRNGAASAEYTYGQPRENIKTLYYDRRGRPFVTADGFAGIKYKRDSLGREIEVTYLDPQQHQVRTRLGYARVTYTYDVRGNVIEEAFFQANDSPEVPVAKAITEFDALGRKVNERYLGPADKPAQLRNRGQHVTLYQYDDYGNVRALRYQDVRGRPTRGYARDFDDRRLCFRWVAHYDQNGQRSGKGECQQRLPAEAEDPRPPERPRTAVRDASHR